LAEWTEPSSATKGVVLEEPWLVHCDEDWGVVGAGAAAILTSPSGIKLQHRRICSNLAGASQVTGIGIQSCILRTDFKVVAGQIENECIDREPTLEKYLSLVRRMEKI
jgi:hypothetical protein